MYIHFIFNSIELLAFGLVCIIVIFLFWLRMNSRLEEEKNKKAIYENFFCSGRLGSSLFSFFRGSLRVSIYEEFIIISGPRKILLRWSDIGSVEVKRYWLSQELFIYHKKKDLGSPIILMLSFFSFTSGREEDKARRIIQSHI